MSINAELTCLLNLHFFELRQIFKFDVLLVKLLFVFIQWPINKEGFIIFVL